MRHDTVDAHVHLYPTAALRGARRTDGTEWATRLSCFRAWLLDLAERDDGVGETARFDELEDSPGMREALVEHRRGV